MKEDIEKISQHRCSFEEIMLPMRDRIRLRTIICRPDDKRPQPTLFMRTPYDFFEPHGRMMCEKFAERGYASIFQQCRGTCGSEGDWVPNENERQDGIDSINWLAGQDWCKSIGIHGESYMALTGWIIADSLPEKVKSLYLGHYSVDRYLSAYKEGLFRHDVLTGWAMGNAGKKVDADYVKSALYRPHINVDEQLWGGRLDWYRKWITSTDYDCEYWHTGVWKTLREIPGKIKVPVCIVAGWYDHHLEGTLLGYESLGGETKAKSRLVIGAWNHSRQACVPAHKPQHAELDRTAHLLEWFDRIMLEEKEPEGGVDVYLIGDDRWCRSDKWPLGNAGTKKIYLSTEKRNDCKAFRLDAGEQGEKDTVQYDYNPEEPVYTHGGETLLVTEKERGSLLQQEPGYREDVLSFVSDTLTEDIRIGGKMNVKLYVSSDCEDTCFSARIMEVLPDGEAYNIRSTVATLAYRNNSRKRLEYKPGEIVEINIELLPVTWNIKAGSRLRVDISSSSFPEYSVHTNYPGIWSLQEKTRLAHQTLHIGGIYGSRLEIPVVGEQC